MVRVLPLDTTSDLTIPLDSLVIHLDPEQSLAALYQRQQYEETMQGAGAEAGRGMLGGGKGGKKDAKEGKEGTEGGGWTELPLPRATTTTNWSRQSHAMFLKGYEQYVLGTHVLTLHWLHFGGVFGGLHSMSTLDSCGGSSSCTATRVHVQPYSRSRV